MLESAHMADDFGEAKMPSVEERLSFLEGKGEEHGRGLHYVREALFGLEQRVTHLDEKIDRRLDPVDRRFEALDQKMDHRFDAVDGRFEVLEQEMDHRFDAVDRRFEVLDQKMDRRFDALDKKIDTKIWSVVGIQIALLLAVIGALLR